MNGSNIQPERAWQMALDQLRLDMPKASFDTWVRDTSFVSFEDGVFTIGTPNAYGREWLASRLTSTVTRLMTGILNQQLVVEFIVTEEILENEEDGFLEEEIQFLINIQLCCPSRRNTSRSTTKSFSQTTSLLFLGTSCDTSHF
jgi:chromosomal replication initiation ATPase DnaA